MRDSVVILDLPQPFAVVAHDVGAANHIIEWLGLERAEYRPFMAGPAGQAWQQRFPARLCHQSLDEALDGARAVLTGTGWGSDLEHRARAAGRSRGLRTVAVLDHWVNYAMRFERPGARVMPDEAWVTDRWAADLARSSFPGLEVKQKPNAYLAAAVREVASRQESAAGTLFVLEPVRDDWGRGFPGEFQALDYFMHRRDVLGIERSEPLRLRPHPSEAPGKYDSWVARHADEGVCLDNSESLFAAISRSRRTVGIQSYALVVADAVGRQAVSTLPPWAPALCLPQPGILELRRLCGESP
jgi:hypothetical protein